MSKGLESFNYIFDTIPMPDVDKETKQKIYCAMDDIEKELKALEIIKEKGIDYHSISAIKQSKDYEDYLDLVKNLITVVFKLTQEEFDLLKEVLCNENNTK